MHNSRIIIICIEPFVAVLLFVEMSCDIARIPSKIIFNCSCVIGKNYTMTDMQVFSGRSSSGFLCFISYFQRKRRNRVLSSFSSAHVLGEEEEVLFDILCEPRTEFYEVSRVARYTGKAPSESLFQWSQGHLNFTKKLNQTEITHYPTLYV
jgi:hypothetical protein